MKPEISIILPCRNEESALSNLLKNIQEVIKKNNLNAEIILSDSSQDNSPKIARSLGAKVIKHDKEGYGNAYLEAFPHAKGKYIIMLDADGTYPPEKIPEFLSELKRGNDLILGNRFAGKMESGAMPISHRLIGNPVLSATLSIFFHKKIKDAHSGMRAITSEALKKLNLKTTGMEFASEMVMKAIKNNLKISEIPINYYKRKGKSKLRSLPDGWRHLRFMLLYSPLFLFFIPGLISLLVGLSTLFWFYFLNPNILGIQFYFHPMFISSLLTIIGYQLIIFSAFAKIYAITHLGEKDERFEKLFDYLTIERASILGILVSLIGFLIYILILIKWVNLGFGESNEIKNSITALTLIVLGTQTIFSSFMLSILGIKEK